MSSAVENLSTVEAVLNYLSPMAERPRSYAFDPPPGIPQTTAVAAPVKVSVRDARPIADRMPLDWHGFALVEHRSAVRDFYDDEEVKRVYYPQAEQALRDATGASRVFIFDHTTRRRGKASRSGRWSFIRPDKRRGRLR